MSTEPNHVNSAGNGDYEHSDIGAAAILYFLAGLAVALLLAYFVVDGLYHYLDKRAEAEQAPVNPMVTTAPADTRRIPKDYPNEAFPDPKLEEDERGQLNGIRLKEEQTLSTYDYVDKNAGTVRIPIERAMDLIAQRGLPTRAQGAGMQAAMTQPTQSQSANQSANQPAKKKGRK
jgi:hypothetical protein